MIILKKSTPAAQEIYNELRLLISCDAGLGSNSILELEVMTWRVQESFRRSLSMKFFELPQKLFAVIKCFKFGRTAPIWHYSVRL